MNETNPMDLSIVIACYNDGDYLQDSLREIELVMAQTRYRYELILIDDCSPDGSARVVKRETEKRANARCVMHKENAGRGATVSEGMRLAKGQYVGFLDIDLEVHCRYLPAMIQALESGYDVATAHRFYEIRWNPGIFFRHILSMGYWVLMRFMLHLPYRDTETGYKFFNREKILAVLDDCQSPGWFWDTEIMSLCYDHELKVKEIPALFLRRPERTTTVKPIRDSIVYFIELLKFRSRRKRRQGS